MKIKQYAKKALSLPPHIVFRKIALKLKKTAFKKKRALIDSFYPSYLSSPSTSFLNRFIDPIDLSLLDRKSIKEHNQRYLQHEFNLLGSGWVQVKHGMTCLGLEGICYPPQQKKPLNKANQIRAKEILSLIQGPYTPIDWQLDFKSGYRWNESLPSEKITYGNTLGADVKVPWELSRMQHLLFLAWGFAFEQEPRFLQEIQNQILDFISSNPPRFGVNWKCTMDVGIRIANWLVCYDLCKAYQAPFDPAFEAVFFQSIHEHAEHIMSHLEWDPYLRSNHYLANLAGLFFIGAYLPQAKKSNFWLQFANEEMQKEILLQFHREGSNFEASTSYHRLSSEMVVYTAALASQIGISFPQKLIQKIGDFIRDITKPDGRIVQVGDNDSGRFLKFFPDQDPLDHRYLISSTRNISSLSATIQAQLTPPEEKTFSCSYPEFGLFIQRKEPWFLSIRCGPIGQRGNGGHAHQDLLSFELSYQNKSFIVDPGTYLYTPFPKERNRFRSTMMHNTLCPEGQSQHEEENLFQMKTKAKPSLLHFDDNLFIAEHFGFKEPHRRELKWEKGCLLGIDHCALPSTRIYFHFAPECRGELLDAKRAVWSREDAQILIEIDEGELKILPSFYSNEYGVKRKSNRLVVDTTYFKTTWEITSCTFASISQCRS